MGRLTREQRLRRPSRTCWSARAPRGVHADLVRRDASDACACPSRSRWSRRPAHALAEPGRGREPERRAGNEEIALFEFARVYRPSGSELSEERRRVARDRRGRLLRAKGAVEALYAALRPSCVERRATALPSGKGRLVRRRRLRGTPSPAAGGRVGRVRARPRGAAAGVRDGDFEDATSYPPVRRDVRWCAEDVPAGALADAVREAAGPGLREVRVFDVYRGDQVGGAGSRSPWRSSSSRRSRRLGRRRRRAASGIVARSNANLQRNCGPSARTRARAFCVSPSLPPSSRVVRRPNANEVIQ